jgi:hypothetical protein
MAAVRRVRPGAIENHHQERFVRAFRPGPAANSARA